MGTETGLPLEKSVARSLVQQSRINIGVTHRLVDFFPESGQEVDPVLPAAIQYLLGEYAADTVGYVARQSAAGWPTRFECARFIELAHADPRSGDRDASTLCREFLEHLNYRPSPAGAFDAACDLYLGRAAIGETSAIVGSGCVGFLYGSGTGDGAQGALGVECGYLGKIWVLSRVEREWVEQRARRLCRDRGDVFGITGRLNAVVRSLIPEQPTEERG